MAQNNGNNVVEIDKLDQKILLMLHKDSRTGISEIGKKIGLSKDAVSYRIAKMLKNGVISKFYLDVDYEALGFTKYVMFIRLNKVSPEVSNVFRKQVERTDEIIFCASCVGNWDYWLEILCDSIDSLDSTMDDLFSSVGESLQEYSLMIISKNYKGYEPIVEKSFDVIEEIENASPKRAMASIDESDYKVMKAIENDSRMTLTDIAKKTGLTIDIVKYRLRRLKEESIITRFDVVLDYNILGYDLNVIIFKLKRFNREHREKFISFLINSENVRSASRIAGRQEIIAEILTRENRQYLSFLNNVRNLFSESLFGYEEIGVVGDIKDVTLPKILDFKRK